MSINRPSSIPNPNSTEAQQRSFPSVQLALNGQPIYLQKFLATVKVVREVEDMSGQNSSTSKSEKGVKAKELHITGLIPFRHADWLKTLFKLAEAEDKKGEQVKYRITNTTAETVNMREGFFVGEVSAVEENVQGWTISFTLSEKNSIAEKKEAQEKKKRPKAKAKTEAKATSASQRSSSTTTASASSSSKTSASSATSSATNGDEPQRSALDIYIEKAGL